MTHDTHIDHQRIARDHFEVTGVATPIPGYVDSNARIDTPDGERFVLRVSPREPDIQRLLFVDEAMQAVKDASFDAPHSLPTTDGALLARLADGRVARLLSWVDGTTAEDAGRPAAAAHSLGRTAAEMVNALEALTPTFDPTDTEWDPGLSREVIAADRHHVTDGVQGSIIDGVMAHLAAVPFDELPRQVIHSDLNAGNIVLTGQSVSGVIDFEDTTHTIRIGELSVACAYAMLTHDQPVPVAEAVIDGYRGTSKISDVEAAHLFTMTLARLAVSVAVAASKPPENPHHHHLSGITWELLSHLTADDHDMMTDRFIRAATGVADE